MSTADECDANQKTNRHELQVPKHLFSQRAQNELFTISSDVLPARRSNANRLESGVRDEDASFHGDLTIGRSTSTKPNSSRLPSRPARLCVLMQTNTSSTHYVQSTSNSQARSNASSKKKAIHLHVCPCVLFSLNVQAIIQEEVARTFVIFFPQEAHTGRTSFVRSFASPKPY